MIILDQVIEASHSDGILIELGLIEGSWALVMYDDLGDDFKTYESEEDAREDFQGFKEGRLQFNALFGFLASPSTPRNQTEVPCAMTM